MLRPLLLTAALEGARPGTPPLRPPVPVVRFDRVAATRAGRVLHDLAARFGGPPDSAPVRHVPPATAPAGAGWRTVLLGLPAPARATR